MGSRKGVDSVDQFSFKSNTNADVVGNKYSGYRRISTGKVPVEVVEVEGRGPVDV